VNRFAAMLQLARVDSSVLGFLGLFIPIYARTKDLTMSLERAIPLLFICMCTFIANDLDDLERDQINHPERPLPGHHLNPAVAAMLYFICLALALFLTRRFIDQRIAFWYYALVTLSISYGYIIECLPSVKAPYVAAAISVPVFIVAESYPDEKRLYLVAVAGFLLALGRELCMDIDDRTGDIVSLMHRIRPASLAIAAFVVQTVGLALLLVQVRRSLDVLVAMFMGLVLVVSEISWFSMKNHKAAKRLMKLLLVVGLYFLT
jgi:geranylgeranylglycerol-phosphate geranylgeranyltransferase